MHPLNTFPSLLDFGRLSPFLIRVVIGLFLIYLGRERQKKNFSPLSFVYYVFGITILLGFYTQVSSIAGVVLLNFDFYVDFWEKGKSNPVPKYLYFLYVIAGLALISLVFSGAGAFAFDMPF